MSKHAKNAMKKTDHIHANKKPGKNTMVGGGEVHKNNKMYK